MFYYTIDDYLNRLILYLGWIVFNLHAEYHLTCILFLYKWVKQLYFDRITRYLDSWPKIEKWYNKFGVLTTVDAAQGMQTVFLEVEKILEDTLAKVKH